MSTENSSAGIEEFPHDLTCWRDFDHTAADGLGDQCIAVGQAVSGRAVFAEQQIAEGSFSAIVEVESLVVESLLDFQGDGVDLQHAGIRTGGIVEAGRAAGRGLADACLAAIIK